MGLETYADGVRKALWQNHRIEVTTDHLMNGQLGLVQIRLKGFLRDRFNYTQAASGLVKEGIKKTSIK